MIIQVVVTQNDFFKNEKSWFSIIKTSLPAKPIKVKTDGIVNNHLSSCNSHQFSFALQQHVASHYVKNSIKLTTFDFLCM